MGAPPPPTLASCTTAPGECRAKWPRATTRPATSTRRDPVQPRSRAAQRSAAESRPAGRELTAPSAEPGARTSGLAHGCRMRAAARTRRDAARQRAAAICGSDAIARCLGARDRLAAAQPLVREGVRALPPAGKAARESSDHGHRGPQRWPGQNRRRDPAAAAHEPERYTGSRIRGLPGATAGERRQRLHERPGGLRPCAEDERSRRRRGCVRGLHRKRARQRGRAGDEQRVAVAGCAQVDRERSAGELRVVAGHVQDTRGGDRAGVVGE